MLPPATGTVQPFELLDLLALLADSRFTGSVRLNYASEEVRIFLRDGEARLCVASSPQHSFTGYLLRRRLFDQATLKGLHDRAKESGKRLETALVEAGILTREAVREHQVTMNRLTLGDVVSQGPASYTLDSTPPPPVVDGFRVEPVVAFFESVRDAPPQEEALRPSWDCQMLKAERWESRHAAALEAFGAAAQTTMARIGEGTTLARESLTGDVVALVRLVTALLRAGMIRFGDAVPLPPPAPAPVPRAAAPTVSSPWVLPTTGVPHEEVVGLTALLRAEGWLASAPDGPEARLFDAPLDVHEPEAPESEPTLADEPAPPAPASPPQDKAPEPEEPPIRLPPLDPKRRPPDDPMLAAIFETRRRIAESHPLEVLGLKPAAPLSAVREAHTRLRAKYDPAHYAGTYMTDDSREDLTVLAQAIDTAARDLADPFKRRRLELLAGAKLDEIYINKYFEAERLCRLGRQGYRKQELKAALEHFQQAIAQNSLDPEYHAWCARTEWDLAVQDKRWDDTARSRVLRHVQDALALQPRFEMAQLLLGRLQADRGQVEEASKTYHDVLMQNPRCSEARDAVKELEKRPPPSGADAAAKGLGSLLGRFRKER